MNKRTSILVALAFLVYAGAVSADGLVFNTDELDFGVVLQGYYAQLKAVITNPSSVEADNVVFEVNSSDFLLSTCSINLPAGASCNLYVQFTPSRKGAFIQYVTVSYELNGFAGKTKLRLEGYSQPFNNISQVQ